MCLFLAFLWLAVAQTCHPECRWQCDDPVCYAACQPVCRSPVCEVCRNASGMECRPTGQCTTHCPDDLCEMDECPACETLCPPLCQGRPNCFVQCEPMECDWRCVLPSNCPRPECHLQCEQPACEAAATALAPSLAIILCTWFLFGVHHQ